MRKEKRQNAGMIFNLKLHVMSTLDLERAVQRVRYEVQPVPCAEDGMKAVAIKLEKFTHSPPADLVGRKA